MESDKDMRIGLLESLNDWIALSTDDQADVIRQLATYLGEDWVYQGSHSYGSDPAHRVPTFLHVATTLLFVLVPGGTFSMGLSDQEGRALQRVAVEMGAEIESIQEQEKYVDNWRPAHPVRVRPFLMAQVPLTVAAVTALSRQHGLDRVSQNLAQDTAAELWYGDGAALADACELALPSEAQWEYAFRAGTTTLFPFGDTLPNGGNWPNPVLDILLITEFGDPRACRAATNPFGLAGMYVGEWCADTYWPGYTHASDEDRPVLAGEPYVLRSGGGSMWPWQGIGEWTGCISAARWGATGAHGYLASLRFVRQL